MMRLDLHVHTAASYDCLSDPETILERARRRGLDRVAITDHNVLRAALELADRYPERVIPGEEVRTEEGIDIIGLYLSEAIGKGTPAAETCRRIREQGGIAYLPHPFAPGKGGSGRFLDRVDGLVDVVEAFNARLHSERLNARAHRWAEERGLPVGAGSDAHTPGEVGRARVECPPHENTPEGLLGALAEARVHGRSSSRIVHLASTWAKIRKKLP